MLIAILIFCIVNFILGLYLLGVVNRGFKFTNMNIDSYAGKNEMVIGVADKVIAKYNKMTETVQEEIRK